MLFLTHLFEIVFADEALAAHVDSQEHFVHAVVSRNSKLLQLTPHFLDHVNQLNRTVGMETGM